MPLSREGKERKIFSIASAIGNGTEIYPETLNRQVPGHVTEEYYRFLPDVRLSSFYQPGGIILFLLPRTYENT